MKSIRAEIEIDAPPQAVWDVLLDFQKYPDWNPFIIELQGGTHPGARLREVVQLPNGKRFRFATRILTMEAPTRLVWEGYYMAPWLFRGEHGFQLIATAGGTKTQFIQTETLTGLLIPVFDMEASRQGYHQMNQALKQAVEKH